MIIGPIGTIIGRYLSPIVECVCGLRRAIRDVWERISDRIFSNSVYQCGLEYFSREIEGRKGDPARLRLTFREVFPFVPFEPRGKMSGWIERIFSEFRRNMREAQKFSG